MPPSDPVPADATPLHAGAPAPLPAGLPPLPLPLPPGPRVQLRRLRPDDLDAFCAYRGDADVGRFQGWTPLPPRQALHFLLLMQAAPPLVLGEWFQLGIAARDGDTLIGDIGLLRHDAARLELGFTLCAEAQGRGLAFEALGLLIGGLWTLPDLQTLLATTDARNTPSARLLRRLGFDRVAVRETQFRGEACTEWDFALPRPATLTAP